MSHTSRMGAFGGTWRPVCRRNTSSSVASSASPSTAFQCTRHGAQLGPVIPARSMNAAKSPLYGSPGRGFAHLAAAPRRPYSRSCSRRLGSTWFVAPRPPAPIPAAGAAEEVAAVAAYNDLPCAANAGVTDACVRRHLRELWTPEEVCRPHTKHGLAHGSAFRT